MMHVPAKKARTKRIMASGVFDLLHPGHIYYLEQSRVLGDELVVVIARDEVVRASKGEPLFDAESRRKMVAALACVDFAVVPDETDPTRYYRTVLALKPDVITLGHDQSFKEEDLARDLAKYGWVGEIVRIGRSPDTAVSSSKLKERVRLTKPSANL